MADTPTIQTANPAAFAADAARVQNPAERANIISGLMAMNGAPSASAPAASTPSPFTAINAQYGPQIAAANQNVQNVAAQNAQKVQAAQAAIPNTPDQQFKFVPPKDSSTLAGLMMVFGAMAGRGSLTPMTAALNNMTGMMQGLHERDLEAYKQQKDQFDQNYKTGVNKFNEYMQKYKAVMEGANYDLAKAEVPLKNLQTEYQMNITATQAELALKRMDEQMQRQQEQMGMEHQRLTMEQQRIGADIERLRQTTGANGAKTAMTISAQFHVPYETAQKAMYDPSVLYGKTAESKSSSQQQILNNRMLGAAKQANEDLSNIAPLTYGGAEYMGQGLSGARGLFGMTKDTLMQKSTPAQDQMYSTATAGLGRSLGLLEAQGGLQGVANLGESIQKQIAAVPGSANISKLMGLAQARQIIDQQLSVAKASPSVTEEQRALIDSVLHDLHTNIPFTTKEVVAFSNDAGGNVPFKDAISKMSGTQATSGGVVPATAIPEYARTHGITEDAARAFLTSRGYSVQ